MCVSHSTQLVFSWEWLKHKTRWLFPVLSVKILMEKTQIPFESVAFATQIVSFTLWEGPEVVAMTLKPAQHKCAELAH